MGVYEGIKDVLNIVQKADNIELYKLLMDVQKDALELLEENRKLKETVRELMKAKDLEDDFEYLDGKDYINHKGTKICRSCWISENRYQVLRPSGWGDGSLNCPKCKSVYKA